MNLPRSPEHTTQRYIEADVEAQRNVVDLGRWSRIAGGAGDSANCSTLQSLVALAVIAAALHDPLQAAIGVARLVGMVLVKARVHARFSSRLA